MRSLNFKHSTPAQPQRILDDRNSYGCSRQKPSSQGVLVSSLSGFVFLIWLLIPGLYSYSNDSSRSLSLEETLLSESSATLARDARLSGDPRQGARIFHQPQMACSKCHQTSGEKTSQFIPGPDLTAWEASISDEELVDAVLRPSLAIRKGWEAVVIAVADGRTISGVLVGETSDMVSLQEISTGTVSRIPVTDIDDRKTSDVSLMPPGQVNQLPDRQAFLDLICYLIAIRDGGRERATELRPSPAEFSLTLPEYESRVDHAGLISKWDADSLERGRKIYLQHCHNCHGDKEQVGSLPTALCFSEGRFKRGNDPYSMYQTLTSGFGLMVPQMWMVPQQKYDVIHYIQETFLKTENPDQYFAVNESYLTGLPKGNTFGPDPIHFEPWSRMNYGPRLVNTYESGEDGTHFAYKGIATRLDAGPEGIAHGATWSVFDHDTLRMAFAWHHDSLRPNERFIDWNGIQFNGRHAVHPRIQGKVVAQNPTGPGWANPANGQFDDTSRVLGRDNRRYGPLPKGWGTYRGYYVHGDQTIFSYLIGNTSIWEMPGLVPESTRVQKNSSRIFTRTFQIGPRDCELKLLVTTCPDPVSLEKINTNHVELRPLDSSVTDIFAAAVQPRDTKVDWSFVNEQLCLVIPPGQEPLKLTLSFTNGSRENLSINAMDWNASIPDLQSLIQGGPALWNQELRTPVQIGKEDGPFAVETITLPDNNPWFAQLRPTGLDFLPDGDRMVLCCWDGDVWLISGIQAAHQTQSVTWRRIASGLFQPLGIKLIEGRVFVTCRDQIVILNDLNGDGETDFYECFNNDHQVTEHFHEFAMGLQVDREKNLYYAKSARHALPAVIPHHGTLIRVSPDGQTSQIVAQGFRAANGVCLNPDGTFIVSDQEGHWTPKNRINWVREGGFYGNLNAYHDLADPSDEAMEQPICWITNTFDRSPAELLWVTSPSWGKLQGTLLNLSYGEGKIYVVPFQKVNGRQQGGMCEFPLPSFPTGLIRGRFHPQDGHLYTCGMYSWAGNRQQPGGLYRIRATGKSGYLPVELNVHSGRVSIRWSDPLHGNEAVNPDHYQVHIWDIKRTSDYGSDHYNSRSLSIENAKLSKDRETLTLEIPNLVPTWCMEIRCRIQDAEGKWIDRVIHNTIHEIPRDER